MTLTPLTPTILPGFTYGTLNISNLTAGGGDEVHLFAGTGKGKYIDVRSGTAASPDVSLTSPVMVTRTMGAVSTNTPAEAVCALTAYCASVSPNIYQPTALAGIAFGGSSGVPHTISTITTATGTATVTTAAAHGFTTGDYALLSGTGTFDGTYAITVTAATTFTFATATTGTSATGTASVSPTTNDALGVFGYARMDVNIPNGIEAGYFATNKTQDLVGQVSVEIQLQNRAAANDYSSNSYALSIGLSISSSGTANVGTGINFARANTTTMDVGIGAPLWSTIGDGTGPFRQALIRDDTNAPYSIRIKGAKTIAAIAVADGAGPVTIGTDAAPAGNQVGARLIVRDPTGGTTTPLVYLGNANGTKSHHVHFETSGSRMFWFLAGTAGDYVSGSGAGDFGLKLNDTGKWFWLCGQTGGRTMGWSEAGDIKIGVTTSNKVGFYGVTPVVQQSAYTQTYSTTSKTVANPTATTLTAASGTADGTVADVGAAFSQATLNNNFQDLATAINALIVDVANVKQVQNAVIDDGQIYGLLA